MTVLFVDFETRSRVDLRSKGVYNYAQDASTDVLCMSYAFDDADVLTWMPDQPFPEAVRNHTGQIRAHNATFERLIFSYVLQIPFKLEQYYCTATQARANCAPGSLEDVGRFASSSMKKDHRGAQLIRLLSIPQADGTFRHDSALLAEMVRYCKQDVRAMRAVSKALRDLSEIELADYHVNERINDRGVLVDVPLCDAAVRYADAELLEIQSLVVELTDGQVQSVRSPKMKDWVLERVGDEAKKLMVVHKDGVERYSIDKSIRANLLAMAEENNEEIPPVVADVIQCADDLWASSVAKFSRLSCLADDEDRRVRGAFVFAGGSATGRASSYGAQVHNFTRKCAAEPVAVRQAMVRGHQIVPQYGKRVTDVLKGMLRPALIAGEGNTLVVADWSAIEGRVHPWLSNCKSGEKKLDVFRSGLDPYKVNACATFSTTYEDVTNEQRQVGKVQELACFTAETKVLTHNGVKAIVEVLTTDLLWDGEKWVTHQGVISKGLRQTINVLGIRVTPDHLIRIGQTWMQAQELVLNKQYLTLALETGSANLPYWAQNEFGKAQLGFAMSAFNAHVVQSRTWYTCITFLKVLQRAVTCALKSLLGFGVKTTTSTQTFALTTTTGEDFLTGYQLAKTDVITQKTEAIRTTVVEAYACTNHGVPTKPLSFGTLRNLMAGINRIWNWIVSTSIRATSLTTLGLSRIKLTPKTNAKYKTCNNGSLNLKPVFDILNSGNLNRFTVVTDVGCLIVHNCGFLGGAGAFDVFGRVYGVRFNESQAKRAVLGWRRANAWAVMHGQELEQAYTQAVRIPSTEFSAGRVTYMFDGLHLWYALPSGRVLCYPYAKLEQDGLTYAKAAFKPSADATEWPRARLWRGLACENITQATANDILRYALRELDRRELAVVLHVHDEIVVECAERDAESVVSAMQEVMCTAPDWAQGLPLAIDIKTMRVYGK